VEEIEPKVAPHDLPPSPALSILAKMPKTLAGRKIGVLVADGFDATSLAGLRSEAKAEKAALVIIAPRVGGAKDSAGKLVEADLSLSGAPSVLFDTVAVLADKESGVDLAANANAVEWVRDAFGHCKVLGHSADLQPLLDAAGVKTDRGVVRIVNGNHAFIEAGKDGRVWEREPKLRPPG
jgi:catalase